MFVNTLTTDDKHSRRNMLNFTQQLEAPLKKTFSRLFLAFMKCPLDLENFEKKDEYPSLVISKVNDSERGGLLKRLKSLASEHHSVDNVLQGSKQC